MESVYRFLAWVILLALALVGLLRATSLRWWQLPPADVELGASAAPALAAGDWVLLWRLTPPSKGSLVACPDPDDPNQMVIGRIIATAGDAVSIETRDVTVNEEPFNVEYNCTQHEQLLVDPESGEEVTAFCEVIDVAGNLHPVVDGSRRPQPSFRTRVKPGHVFLLSDNRVHPFDSRHFGTLPREQCRETVFFRVVSGRGFFDVERRFQYIR